MFACSCLLGMFMGLYYMFACFECLPSLDIDFSFTLDPSICILKSLQYANLFGLVVIEIEIRKVLCILSDCCRVVLSDFG